MRANALGTGGTAKPLRQRHQFGGTLGGPLRLPRSFYFVSAEGINGREADTRQAHVPTAAERAGDFSASGVAIRDPFTGQPFPGGVIPAVAAQRGRRRGGEPLPGAQSRRRRRPTSSRRR